ncbi:3-isopropylmalate dehydrogenase [Actinomycetaceae bacterium MB13-C1-2]|nr:3-isopropylmalate dehydrogenase [Actinomycetaceae bacterium MB13-C1-2]
MSGLSVAVIEGDGIGPEVTTQAVRVLTRVGADASVDLQLKHFDLGCQRYLDTGHILEQEDLDELARFDAILLGAVGDPRVKPGIIERGLLLKLRFAFDQYVNLRPSVYYPGVASPLKNPEGIDFVVVREGTEGPYVGNGGALRVGTPNEVATEVSVNTAFAVERLLRYAFELAQSRPAKKLTLVHKVNVLTFAGGVWTRIADEVGSEFLEVEVEYLHVDAATIHLLTRPADFDVIATDNLFGDILTDEAAAITGGIGLAASGNINPTGVFPSMFEPIHGSAPDIAGKGIADPIAAIASVQLLLEAQGYTEEAARVNSAIKSDMEWRAVNPDAVRSTVAVGDAVLGALDAQLHQLHS